jgi:hypothetical protein
MLTATMDGDGRYDEGTKRGRGRIGIMMGLLLLLLLFGSHQKNRDGPALSTRVTKVEVQHFETEWRSPRYTPAMYVWGYDDDDTM